MAAVPVPTEADVAAVAAAFERHHRRRRRLLSHPLPTLRLISWGRRLTDDRRASRAGRTMGDDVLRVRRVEVVDGEGRVRVVIGAVDDHAFGLVGLDPDGGRCLELTTGDDGASLAFGLGGDVVLALGVHGPGSDAHVAGPYVHVADPDDDTTDGL